MFSFKYALFCIAAGLLAGWSFDKKNNIPILGVGVYIFVINAFSLTFNYDQSWAFLAFIEMLAGHGLYKMGFGNFLGELFYNKQGSSQANEKSEDSSKSQTPTNNDITATDMADAILILKGSKKSAPKPKASAKAKTSKTTKEDEERFKSIQPNDFDDSY
jgi:hypothetical protein